MVVGGEEDAGAVMDWAGSGGGWGGGGGGGGSRSKVKGTL